MHQKRTVHALRPGQLAGERHTKLTPSLTTPIPSSAKLTPFHTKLTPPPDQADPIRYQADPYL